MMPIPEWGVEMLAGLMRPEASGFPFSFLCDGRPSSRFLESWECDEEEESATAAGQERALILSDPQSGLEVICEMTRYTDSPAVEWTLYFGNWGSGPSPLVEDISALDILLPALPGRTWNLHGARGGLCTPADYEPLRFDLPPHGEARLAAGGGRSSNGHLPFFNLDAGDRGLVVAVGWSGQWEARFAVDAQGAVRLRADVAGTCLRLHPGERRRTSRILALFWKGDRFQGHNALRRLIRRHGTPRLEGRAPLPPLQCNTWFPVGDDGGKASEQNQVELLRAYGPLGIEYLVMDAGWYGGPEWWKNVGTWEPRQDTFPRGLEPVGEAAAAAGIRFGMWFEPERVRPGSRLDAEHPEWLLTVAGEENRLLNLGLAQVQDWFVELVSGYVDSVPLGYFRHDFNMDPLEYWRQADPADRAGITQIRYVEGLYTVWDRLHERYPGLLIEGCSSGGRRIDLESISRCHTYWKSDLYGFSDANQGHVYGASLYLPGNYLNTPLFDVAGAEYAAPHYVDRNRQQGRLEADDPYAFRSTLGGALCLGWDPCLADFDEELARQRIAAFRTLRPLAMGDFYPLCEYSLDPARWMAYQFYREDLGMGMALLFRRQDCAETELEVELRSIRPDREYAVRYAEEGAGRPVSGADLRRPQRVTVEQAPGSALIVYEMR